VIISQETIHKQAEAEKLLNEKHYKFTEQIQLVSCEPYFEVLDKIKF
jgi:hypothetical protein